MILNNTTTEEDKCMTRLEDYASAVLNILEKLDEELTIALQENKEYIRIIKELERENAELRAAK